jgi:hypothetical protein
MYPMKGWRREGARMNNISEPASVLESDRVSIKAGNKGGRKPL